MSDLGIRLKQARKAAGLSLRALADIVNLSHAAIKKYEDAAVRPSSEMLTSLAKAVKVPVDFFFRPNIERAFGSLMTGSIDSYNGAVRVLG